MCIRDRGDTVSQFYDNLVGKLIVWGSDRATAISRMRSALVELEVGGIATTAAAHSAILASPDFQAGEHSTKWVEESLDLSGVVGKAGDATNRRKKVSRGSVKMLCSKSTGNVSRSQLGFLRLLELQLKPPANPDGLLRVLEARQVLVR